MSQIAVLLENRYPSQHSVARHIRDKRMAQPKITPRVRRARGNSEKKQQHIAFRRAHRFPPRLLRCGPQRFFSQIPAWRGNLASMISLRRVLCCFFLFAPLYAAGYPIQGKPTEGLEGKVVFLRGMDMGDKLTFNAEGAQTGTATQGPFAYSAVKIKKVQQSDTELKIKADRLALIFERSTDPLSASDFHFIRLSDSVNITIALDPSHPELLGTVIQKIFALSLKDDLSGRSSEEVKTALATLGLRTPSDKIPDLGTPNELPSVGTPANYSVGSNGVYPPRMLYTVSPAAADQSAVIKKNGKKHFEGICVLGLTVDTNGIPGNIRVVRSVGPELDRKAMEAVSQYRFMPATRKGQPIAVQINLEINFRIY
jgi:protein TonB